MKTLTSIKLIPLVILFFFISNINLFSQVNFPAQIEKFLTAQHLEHLDIANQYLADANLKLEEAEKIEYEFKKLESKDNTDKYENKIWEAKACRIAAQELLLESDIIVSNIYFDVYNSNDFASEKNKAEAIHKITMSQLKLEVASESLAWFKDRVRNKLADVLNSTIISFMETIQAVQKEALNFQNQAMAFYMIENQNTQLSVLE